MSASECCYPIWRAALATQAATGRSTACGSPPRLPGTKWDALPAATAEHVAITHGHPVPDWCDEPERSLKIYWMPLHVLGKRFADMICRDTPGAFRRYGGMIGDQELGEREGGLDYGALFER